MKVSLLCVSVAAACVTAPVAVAVEREAIGATDILYMAGATWAVEMPDAKLALSRAFMRIFCTDLRMSPERLVECIDEAGGSGPVFERALACAKTIDRS